MTEQQCAHESRSQDDDIAVLASVLPNIGPYVLCGSRPTTGKSHQIFESVLQLVEAGRALSASGSDVYFWVSTPIDPQQKKIAKNGRSYVQPRSQQNAKEVRALILDVDIRPDKPERFHTSKAEAAKELSDFCKLLGIPLPTIIDSGGGLHCYWPFEVAISAAEWSAMARQFKLVLQANAPRLAADPTRIADSASLLRVPGTINYKRKRPVKLIHACTKQLPALSYAQKLSDCRPNSSTPQGDSPLAAALNCSQPVELGPIESGCSWIKQYRDAQAEASEPEWYAVLGLVKHLRDGDRTSEDIARSYSEGHAGYDSAATLEKLRHAREGQSGPTTCARFRALRPDRCQGCPYHGRIVSPIQIATVAPQNTRNQGDTSVDIVDDAFEKLANDAGALYEPNVLSSLRLLHASSPADFARVRSRAKDSKLVTMAEFDRLTLPDDLVPSDDSLFPETVPYPAPVDGAELLGDIAATLAKYVVADAATIYAATLWIVHTWLIDHLTVTPIANITAPEKRCGKTVMLTMLGHLSYRPLPASNISPAAMYRAVQKWKPTLLIDEVDSFLRNNDETRGIIDSGSTRASAYVIRCVGDDSEPTRFSTWGAKALSGIGSLPDTIADRSIPLRLRRKTLREPVSNLRLADPLQWEQYRARIKRWADDNCSAVGTAPPARLEELNDRANDMWEPLFAIADVAGGDWPNLARQAALELHGGEEDTQGKGVELLANIRTVFERRETPNVLNADLLSALVGDPEWRWGAWNRGKPMTQRQLTKLLKGFDVSNHSVRTERAVNGGRGYSRSDFEDAFARYLPGAAGTPAQPQSEAPSAAAYLTN